MAKTVKRKVVITRASSNVSIPRPIRLTFSDSGTSQNKPIVTGKSHFTGISCLQASGRAIHRGNKWTAVFSCNNAGYEQTFSVLRMPTNLFVPSVVSHIRYTKYGTGDTHSLKHHSLNCRDAYYDYV